MLVGEFGVWLIIEIDKLPLGVSPSTTFTMNTGVPIAAFSFTLAVVGVDGTNVGP
jgi:hypothetical protein